MKKIVFITFLLVISINIFAQYTGGAYEQRRLDLQKNTESLNKVYTNNLPNNYGQSSGVKLGAGSIPAPPKYEKTAYEKKLDSFARIEAQAYSKKIEQQNYDALVNRIKFKENYCNSIFEKCIAANSIIDNLDLKEYCQWAYTDTYGGTSYLKDIQIHFDRLRAHLADANNENFDSCRYRLYDFSCFPNTCIRELNKLKKRFPKDIDLLEKQELMAMKYMFGALIPKYEATNNDVNYPKCQYELSTPNEKVAILNRFLELFYKYPDVALLKVAGKTRIGFNPFSLVTTVSGHHGGVSEELKFNMHKMILITKEDSILPIYKKNKWNEERVQEIINKRLEKTIRYFRDDYPFYLYSLSAINWQEIAIAQRIDLKTLGYFFNLENKESKPLQSYVNYQQALKGNFEANTKSGFAKITIRFDKYEGDIMNGAPNGQGKWIGAGVSADDYFEGIFKNGVPTKVGLFKKADGTINRGFEGLDFDSKENDKFYIKYGSY
jgi:hypothetical protein